MNRSIKNLMLLAALSLGGNSVCTQESAEPSSWPKTAAQVALGSLCMAAAAYGAMNADVSYVAELCADDAKKEMIRYACRGTAASLFSAFSFYVLFNDEDGEDDEIDRMGLALICPLIVTLGAIDIASAYQIFNQAN